MHSSTWKFLTLVGPTLALNFLYSSSRADNLGVGSKKGDKGYSGKGAFTGTIDYFAGLTNTTGSLTVTLKNISPTANSGFITAFLFNNPFNDITGVSLSTSTNLNKLLGGGSYKNTIKADPLDNFDIGASLGGTNTNGFEGAGGSPNGGIGVGQTGSFTFTLTGKNLNTLTTKSFENALDDSGKAFFYVRFKGFKDGDSDKVTGIVTAAAVPELSTMLGFGSFVTLGGIALLRQRKQARTAA